MSLIDQIAAAAMQQHRQTIPVSKLFWANIFSIVVSDVYAGECIDSGGYGFDTFGGERR